MNYLDQTQVWIIFGAIIAGIFIGGKVVLSIMHTMGGIMRPPMHRPYYPPNDYDLPASGSGDNGCLIYIVIIIVGAFLFRGATNSKLVQDLLKNGKEHGGVINTAKETDPVFSDSAETATIPAAAPQTDPISEETISSVKEDEKAEDLPETEETPEMDWYIVQTGSFTNWDYAEAQMEDLTNSGLRTGYYTKQNSADNTTYNVFIGTYSLDDAKTVKQEQHHREAIIRPAEGLDLQYYEGR